jgi:hypothetical protein
LLDVHRRRKFVERKVTWIDDADVAEGQEPQSAIGGLADPRAITDTERMASDSVGTVENRGLDYPVWIVGPGVQLRPGNSHEATGRIQPD